MATVAADVPPKQGEIVRVRSRRYLVEGVEPATVPEDQTLVRLSCLEDDAEGEELEVLWEKEVDAQRISTADWTKLAQGNFDDPRYFGAYYHTLRWNSVTSTDPQLFQAPYRAGTVSADTVGHLVGRRNRMGRHAKSAYKRHLGSVVRRGHGGAEIRARSTRTTDQRRISTAARVGPKHLTWLRPDLNRQLTSLIETLH